MSFLLEFVGHLIKQSMEDPVARREARNAHLRDTNERAQALCVYPCASQTRKHTSLYAPLLLHRCLWRAWRTGHQLVLVALGCNPMRLSTAAHSLPPALSCTRKDKWAQTIKAPQFWQSEEGAATARAAGNGLACHGHLR